jgi:hypothetical protein
VVLLEVRGKNLCTGLRRRLRGLGELLFVVATEKDK